jgi:phosphoribosylformylglycinamidine synthase
MNNASADVVPKSNRENQASTEAVVWQVDILPRSGLVDRIGGKIRQDVRDAQWNENLDIVGARGFLIQSPEPSSAVAEGVERILVDPIAEDYRLFESGDAGDERSDPRHPTVVHVLLKPGVTDPEADSAREALRDFGLNVDAVRTFRKFWLPAMSDSELSSLGRKFLANDSIEQMIIGPLRLMRIDVGSDYAFELKTVPLRSATPNQLLEINRLGQLSLSLEEMATIQKHFRTLDRDPTDAELETVAQTWSEHCSHKTLAGAIDYQDETGTTAFGNMLRETIFAATESIRKRLGADDWCISVFRDNAGIVRFDEQTHVAVKVETHNRPSALEPYGGANTGIGGVIRDILGTGLGAKPIASTDVFCFAPPDLPPEKIPPNVLHPRRIMKGVVAGVRDYGNRMGIPTVNGAICFDERYVGNPLVFCGSIGVLSPEHSFKQPQPNDWIVAIGGRTGRDGIHGATFSSADLHQTSDQTSGGAVQIGNAIMEKMFQDVLLQARDEKLFHAVTDCGAGGFSSAVGEMGESIGAEVWLERVPLKYRGLSYTEIWISEAQERMVLAVPPEKWDRLQKLCASEDVEATIIGQFKPTGRLTLKFDSRQVADLSMDFLHGGRPKIRRPARYTRPPALPIEPADLVGIAATPALLDILGSYNVASKHWVIRQYDHEVQAGSVIKPLVGANNDGPSDAAVLRPRLDSNRGLVVACGINPRYGDLDPYHMAASAIDEAIRNCIAVGADPARIAILDNFCWGRTDRPETLGTLVRAALACRDVAVALQTPFISGKDSLHNEFRFTDDRGQQQVISIPGTLLITAVGQIGDVRQCVTMDFKQPGNPIFLIGQTGNELGGSHLAMILGLSGGRVPTVDPPLAKRVFEAVHRAIGSGTVRACHDLSEGGLSVALAEMALAGNFGALIDIAAMPLVEFGSDLQAADTVRLFSESNSRFLVEVTADRESAFISTIKDVPHIRLGEVTDSGSVVIRSGKKSIVQSPVEQLKKAWQSPLDWS